MSLVNLARQALLSGVAVVSTGCGRHPAEMLDHGLAYQRMGANRPQLELPSLHSRSSRAVILLGIGRGKAAAFDNPAFTPIPTFSRLGDIRPYTLWPASGTGLYVLDVEPSVETTSIVVGTPPMDEVTAGAIVVAGSEVVDYSWKEVPAARLVKSQSVKTTGPATLVAFWWGDAGVDGRKLAIPGSGFRLVDSILHAGALVQSATAVRRVEKAGTYDVTWYSAPLQGAQLWLVAIQ